MTLKASGGRQRQQRLASPILLSIHLISCLLLQLCGYNLSMLAGAAVSLLSVLYSDFGDRQGVERGLHDSANAGCRDCGCAPLGGDGRTYCNMDNGKETATRCCRHCTFKPGSAYGGACESLAIHGMH
jgi:hypothetical protein